MESSNISLCDPNRRQIQTSPSPVSTPGTCTQNLLPRAPFPAVYIRSCWRFTDHQFCRHSQTFFPSLGLAKMPLLLRMHVSLYLSLNYFQSMHTIYNRVETNVLAAYDIPHPGICACHLCWERKPIQGPNGRNFTRSRTAVWELCPLNSLENDSGNAVLTPSHSLFGILGNRPKEWIFLMLVD